MLHAKGPLLCFQLLLITKHGQFLYFFPLILKMDGFSMSKVCFFCWKSPQPSFLMLPLCFRKLIFWVWQAALRALRATGSRYRSQVRRVDKPMMTAETSRVALARGCVRAFSRPEDRNLSMAAEIVKIPEIPPDPKQPVTSREARNKERLLAEAIRSAPSAGAIFHRIKALLFMGFAAMIYGV